MRAENHLRQYEVYNMRVSWTIKYEQLYEQVHGERKEGKRRDATIVIGSLLIYAQVQDLTPFIPEKRSATTAS